MSNLKCSVCNLTLTQQRQQIRSDDEEATLVTVCPTHGTLHDMTSRVLKHLDLVTGALKD
jgi:hypothetical protein